MPTGRQPQRARTATLACGVVTEYEAPDLVPMVGDLVPCRRHGHCLVVLARRGRSVATRQRRSGGELVAHLEQHGPTTLRALREERFSLRLIADAEKAGCVRVDLAAALVTCVRAAGPSSPALESPVRQVTSVPREESSR